MKKKKLYLQKGQVEGFCSALNDHEMKHIEGGANISLEGFPYPSSTHYPYATDANQPTKNPSTIIEEEPLADFEEDALGNVIVQDALNREHIRKEQQITVGF